MIQHKTHIGFSLIAIGTILSILIVFADLDNLTAVSNIMNLMDRLRDIFYSSLFCAIGAVVATLPWKSSGRNFISGGMLLAAGQLVMAATGLYFIVYLPKIATFGQLVIASGILIGFPIAGNLLSACGAEKMESDVKSMWIVKLSYLALMTLHVLMFMLYMTAVSFLPKTNISDILSNVYLSHIAIVLVIGIVVAMLFLIFAWMKVFSSSLGKYIHSAAGKKEEAATSNPDSSLNVEPQTPATISESDNYGLPVQAGNDYSRFMPPTPAVNPEINPEQGTETTGDETREAGAITGNFSDCSDAELMKIVESDASQWSTDDREAASQILFERRSTMLFDRLGGFTDAQLHEVISSPHVYYKGYILAAKHIIEHRANRP